MPALMIHGADDPGAALTDVIRLGVQDGDPRPAWPQPLRMA